MSEPSRARKGAVEASWPQRVCRIDEVIRSLDRGLPPAALLSTPGGFSPPVRAPRSLRRSGLSLAFQAQLPAHAQP